VFLHYRRADQSQAWQRVEMTAGDGGHRAAIPADYTQSPYPLLYYFEVDRAGTKAIYPGFNANLSNQPYYLVRSSRATVAQPS